MATLGDYLPQKEKEQYIDEHLQSGQILYLFCDFTTPPKEKYLVLACPGHHPFLFMINSDIHPFIAARPELRKCQIRLDASEYDLDHDSYINCSKVIDEFSEEDIYRQLGRDLSRIKKELTQKTKQEMIQVVSTAKTIKKHIKTLIIQALQAE
jgi:hypothetical protein